MQTPKPVAMRVLMIGMSALAFVSAVFPKEPAPPEYLSDSDPAACRVEPNGEVCKAFRASRPSTHPPIQVRAFAVRQWMQEILKRDLDNKTDFGAVMIDTANTLLEDSTPAILDATRHLRNRRCSLEPGYETFFAT